MRHNKKPKTPQWEWEEQLLQAYYDYRWREVLDPLYQQMQLWKQGELKHDDINLAIHKTHKQTQELYGVFAQKRDFLIFTAQADQEWFANWSLEHTPLK